MIFTSADSRWRRSSGGELLKAAPLFLHGREHRSAPLRQLQADEPGVARVAASREQAGGFHSRRHLHDRRWGHAEAAGELAGRLTVLLGERGQHEVLADTDAVTAHRGIGGAAHQL